MYPHQAERLARVLDGQGLVALVATSRANIAYLTGFTSATREVYRTPSFAVFAPRGTALVVDAIDLATVVDDGIGVDHVSCFGGFVAEYAEPLDAAGRRIRALADGRAASPVEALAAALDAVGARDGTVGLDEGFVTPEAWGRIGARLPALTLVPAAEHFLAARRIKGPWELECLDRALAIAEAAANEVVQMLRPGVTEREAARVFRREALERGGVASTALVTFGPRASIPATAPSDRALRAGDLVRFDFGCAHGGYCAAVGRTGVVGEPTARLAEASDALLAGMETALERIRPGVSARDVHRATTAAVRGAGLPGYRRDHVGHGIGLEPYERPELAAEVTTELETGEVLRVETPYHEHGGLGLSLTETVLVTRAGSRALNRSARGLVVLD